MITGEYDVAVIGGGPSGAVAARELAVSGAKVILIEKDVKRVKPCGGGTPYKTFQEFNLPQKEIVKKIETISTVSPSGERLDISLNGRGYVAMVERGLFDHALRRQAEDAGVEMVEAEFSSLKEAKEKICITIIEDGKERDIRSDFLIAADGVNSRVAGAAGLKPLPGVFTIREEVDLKAAEDFQHLNACEFWFSSTHAPGFYSWVFPKKDYVDIGTASVQGKRLRELMNNFKRRRGVHGNGRQRVYRLPLKCRDKLVKNNILFVGDAAGLVMPLSYEGIYYAVRSGKMGAEAVIRGRPKEYEKEWNKKFRRQFKLMNALKKYFMRNDRTVEQMFVLHRRKEVQEASLKLWLEKDISPFGFLRYLNFFRRFLL